MFKGTIPDTLYIRFIKLMFTGIAIIILSIAIASTGVLPTTFFETMGPALLIGGVFIAMGLWFRWSISKTGFEEHIGINTGAQYGVLQNVKLKRKPISYILQCESYYLEVPAARINYLVPEGTKMKVFTPKNVLMYEKEGIKKPTTIWGVEILSD